MNLAGIENENGYFPELFFAENLAAELSERASATDGADNLGDAAGRYRAMATTLHRINDPEVAVETRRAATHELLAGLGYAYRRDAVDDGAGTVVPVLARVADADGRDAVWILEAPVPPRGEATMDPLALVFTADQLPEDAGRLASRPIEDTVGRIFARDRAPRYVIVVGLTQIVLARRDRWQERALLRVDVRDAFTRADREAAWRWLLARETLAPETGVALADQLDEEARRRTNAVTASLKKTVRDAIEILGQEVLDVTGGKYPPGYPKSLGRYAGKWIVGEDLRDECLRYMYRLLFLFYAEANPHLGLLDMKDPVYRTGYSLQALRELENVRLRSPEEREGTYLWQSLERLLALMHQGTGERGGRLRIAGIKVALLDPASTPLLSRLTGESGLRNEAVQKVIRLLSLEKRRRSTVRISYDRLGIGQLGAVYETLISFTGFVAREDLIELRPGTGRGTASDEEDPQEDDAAEELETEGDEDGAEEDEAGIHRTDDVDTLAPTWFVERRRAKEFSPEQIVYDGPEPRIYPKGTFVYRLAGRDREKSASYYTPEPLARLLVKHALMERCRDMPADEILKLKILEPAMGSAAFLVETTNQLADLYLERKQAETGRTIPRDREFAERQKVRAFIADRNCFGVDLNPIAMELGAISLWLNSLHRAEFSPWFGDQLHAGHSLIGARRAAYAPTCLSTGPNGKKLPQKELWHQRKPEEIGWRGTRPDGHVWQFLLPAADMAKFDGDASIKEFAEGAQTAIKAWRKEWLKPLGAHEVATLQRLSAVVDALFEAVADDLAASRAATNDAIAVWPHAEPEGAKAGDFHDKERRLAVLRGEVQAGDTLPYRRLKTAMDAWCALWLWPLSEAHLLPSRMEWIQSLALILDGGAVDDGTEVEREPTFDFEGGARGFDRGAGEDAASGEDGDEDGAAMLPFEAADAMRRALPSAGRFRPTDVAALVKTTDWLAVAGRVAREARFMHFDLEFADVLRARGGFDLIVGNPPWAKPSWNEGDVIGEIDPAFVVKKFSAHEMRQARADILTEWTPPEDFDWSLPTAKANAARLRNASPRVRFLREYARAKGAMNATGSAVMNPFAGGGQNNLYRCFVDLAFRLMAPEGVAALIHQDGHLTDPKAGVFRREWYRRVRRHYEFLNALTAKNFSEVAHYTRFSLNVYAVHSLHVGWTQFSNGLISTQVEASLKHDGVGMIPAIKTIEGKWETRGHRDRIVRVDRTALEAIHALSESAEVPVDQTRFLQPYSAKMLDVFRAMAAAPSLDEAVGVWQMRSIWHEANAQKVLGVIRRETSFHCAPGDLIYSGPIFHVGNPVYKSPKAVCRTKADYEVVDLSFVGEDYLPRANYAPAVDKTAYRAGLPGCRWNDTLTHTDHYRVALRRRINLNSERSLISAILPPDVAHIDSVESVAFRDEAHVITTAAMLSAIPYDFLAKSYGQGDIRDSTVGALPFVDPGPTAKHRALRLACLTRPYADLWNRHAKNLVPLPWSKDDPRLPEPKGPAAWDRTAALRTDYARRMALVEIDVLVARALGLTIDQLVDIYRIYFPVLQQNEAATWYDATGRIVWTASKGLPGIGWLDNGKSPGRAAWDKIRACEPERLECMATIDFLPGGPQTVPREFIGPFDTCDRIADYRRAWAHFDRLDVAARTPEGTA